MPREFYGLKGGKMKEWIEMEITYDYDICIGCGECATNCSTGAIAFDEEEEKPYTTNPENCMACFTCREVCTEDAISHQPEIEYMRFNPDEELPALMRISGALSQTLAKLLGPSSSAPAFLAGKDLAKDAAKDFEKADEFLPHLTEDIEKALEELTDAFKGGWRCAVWHKKGVPQIRKNEEGNTVIDLVFRECVIRETLKEVNGEQKGPLCRVASGFIAGVLEEVTGKKVELEIIHAGPRSCLKELTIFSE